MNARQKDKYKKSPDTLMKAILSMQKKLEENEQDFIKAPLAVEVELGDGRWVPRPNPFVKEYRALVRDFSAALKVYKEITGTKGEKEQTQLDDIRSRFKIAK